MMQLADKSVPKGFAPRTRTARLRGLERAAPAPHPLVHGSPSPRRGEGQGERAARPLPAHPLAAFHCRIRLSSASQRAQGAGFVEPDTFVIRIEGQRMV